jgi:hypothetical protein
LSIQELEAEALKLPEEERARLAERLLASLGRAPASTEDDPIFGLGTDPVATGVRDAAAQHDHYLYGAPTVLLDAQEHERLAERAELLDDVAAAERQIDAGEGVEHEAARAELIRRLKR